MGCTLGLARVPQVRHPACGRRGTPLNRSQTTAQSGGELAGIAALLACPLCRAPLGIGPDWIRCEGCDARYPIEDGVPRLAIFGGSESWGVQQATGQSVAYQSEFEDIASAADYNEQFRRKPLKLGVSGRERRLIRRFLKPLGRSRVILEIPCGGGRLTPGFADLVDVVIEADVAIGQVAYGRRHSQLSTPCVWLTASAFHIPLRDGSVDGAVCIRLSHHLPTSAERERLFGELLRVSRRFVIVTFFDRHSLKNLTYRLRHPFRGGPPKLTMTRSEVDALARAGGGKLVAVAPLSRIASGHRYALILKAAH